MAENNKEAMEDRDNISAEEAVVDENTASGESEATENIDDTIENTAQEASDASSEPSGEADENKGTDEAEGAGQADNADQTEDRDAEEKSGKSSFRDRKNRKFQKELEKKDEAIADLTDRYKRLMAEFENFRKRTDKEKASRYDDGAMGILSKMLPVADNFERGLAQIPDESRDDPYVQGMDMIYKQFMKVLEESGVTPIDALGKEFDPNFHNAVMHVEDEEMGDNVVAEELLKGYMYKDTVLRHSMVKVAN